MQHTRDPPEGESGQEPSERRKRNPARGPNKELPEIRQRSSQGNRSRDFEEGPVKKPARESETRPRRGTKKRLARESDTSLTQHSGNPLQALRRCAAIFQRSRQSRQGSRRLERRFDLSRDTRERRGRDAVGGGDAYRADAPAVVGHQPSARLMVEVSGASPGGSPSARRDHDRSSPACRIRGGSHRRSAS